LIRKIFDGNYIGSESYDPARTSTRSKAIPDSQEYNCIATFKRIIPERHSYDLAVSLEYSSYRSFLRARSSKELHILALRYNFTAFCMIGRIGRPSNTNSNPPVLPNSRLTHLIRRGLAE
jgi:hypothetical protein